MICPTCNHHVPDNLLACPGCTEDRSRASLVASQLGPLRAVMKGDANLTVRTVGNSYHVQLFGFEHTFCNLHVSPQARRRRITYDAAELKKLCATCRYHVEHLMEEACRSI